MSGSGSGSGTIELSALPLDTGLSRSSYLVATDAGGSRVALSSVLGLVEPSDISTAGATTGYSLVYNGTTWAPAAVSGGGGSTTPGGSNGQVQVNSNGSFGALTETQLTALISPFTAATSGAVPAYGTAQGRVLSDGGWTVLSGSYSLPPATSTVLGGVKPDGTTIANTSGAISVSYGTTANTAAEGNDSRIVGALQAATAASTYATSASLASYVTSSSLTTTLASYALTTSLSSYITTSELSTSLSSYATTASLSSYATTSSLSSYATTSSLSSYATTSSLGPLATQTLDSAALVGTSPTGQLAAATAATVTGLVNLFSASTKGAVPSFTAQSGQVLTDGGWVSPISLAPTPLICSCPGAPAAGSTFWIFPLANHFTIPANFAGSYASVGTAPTGAVSFTIAYIRAGTQTTIGTINFMAGGYTASFTDAAQIVLSPGDLLVAVAPSVSDSTLSNLGFALVGTRS